MQLLLLIVVVRDSVKRQLKKSVMILQTLLQMLFIMMEKNAIQLQNAILDAALILRDIV